MNAFFTYILEANIYLAVFISVFLVLFRNERFHRLNRFVLLGSILLAFIIPLIPLAVAETSGGTVLLQTVVVNGKAQMIQAPAGKNWPSLLSLIYLVGWVISVFFLIRKVLQLRAQIKAGRVEEKDGWKVVKKEDQQSPSSFFNTLFTNDQADQNDLIIAHERVHLKELHSLDIMLLHTIQCFCWFNPAIYFAMKAIEASHEFRADEVVLQNSDRESYSNLLLSTAFNINPSVFTHQFSNKTLLKRRIMMLHDEPKRMVNAMKYLLWIPILGISLFIHSCSEKENDQPLQPSEKNSLNAVAHLDSLSKKLNTKLKLYSDTMNEMSVKDRNAFVKDLINEEGLNLEWTTGKFEPTKLPDSDIYMVVEQMPTYPGGEDALMAFLKENIKYPEAAKESGVAGTVYVSFIIDEEGSVKDISVKRSPDERLSANAIDVIGRMPAWKPGMQDGKAVNVQFMLPIQYSLE